MHSRLESLLADKESLSLCVFESAQESLACYVHQSEKLIRHCDYAPWP
jgi:hypothetical protein